ncbi:Glycine cleavage system protein P (pyridoxal-binding), N-terminal domain [Halalkaliarchaeum sp. AArc-CO]|uniref:aminomethyl-transferring glycine dehydrogenase subunit GcvPA n=1 Tax=unclassified Halalkaliarchaeum TaxID=2678344 RepID=UPI00217D81F4|nr:MULTISPECIES: aminomethyl-transferring glycine dehydrogenase subunit GcvPA [unclassified Halalkaliarchaeum]MDR5674071.1 aminomethyl-transferring glycine dehydrogenase subunit GcvPA [Halalkaliarchaeum sp. AArc-GB]UWG50803.1 Glycine cleavage system protein P (pyridoxal-binding), N-terminal domain [Halalkaliarchaeum sp. AArc-CO]
MTTGGTPFAPHTDADVAAMLEAVGVDDESELFDIPEEVAFDGDLDIEARGEPAVKSEVRRTFARNDDLTEFLGRGHYSHYVPSLVDHLSLRAEFLTSYTQYQPEITQGFLQALFEYQSLIVELTGLEIANCSMYDGATALGEAATLASRLRQISGDTVLIPEQLRDGKQSVLENYCDGADLVVETYPMDDGAADVDAIRDRIGEDVVAVYAENPTVRGVIQEELSAVGDLADEHDALFVYGTDPVAMALLEQPAALGVDVVVGEADALGLPTSFGMGLGLFATKEEYLRQVPGRLVGASDDDAGNRAYTLTLQTREQHIRKERATSNICTNQAWVALRAAMHAALLGPTGLVDLATDAVENAAELSDRIDELSGFQAPVHDRHHFREFLVRSDQPAAAIAGDLESNGYAVHVVDDHLLQVCVDDTNEAAMDGLVAAFEEVAR